MGGLPPQPGDAEARAAPEGDIDPWMQSVSFWDGDKPLVAMHAFATHPQSYYRKGMVSGDFPGIARNRRQGDDAGILQVHFAGASGNITAGKYNDGSPAMRPVLLLRLRGRQCDGCISGAAGAVGGGGALQQSDLATWHTAEVTPAQSNSHRACSRQRTELGCR